MIEVDIPGGDVLRLEHLVADYNGTLAVNGQLLPSVAEGFRSLAGYLKIHVVTADTFGFAAEALAGLPCKLSILPEGRQDVVKLDYLKNLGPENCVALGNGRNDQLMLAAAGLGIAVIEGEGAAVTTLMAAKIVVHSTEAALGLLLSPKRLIATLRI